MLRGWLLLFYVVAGLLLLVPSTDYPQVIVATLAPTALALWYGPLALIGARGTRRVYDPATLFNTAMFYYAMKGATLAGGEWPSFLQIFGPDSVIDAYLAVALFTTLGLLAWNLAYARVMTRRGVAPVEDPAAPAPDAIGRAVLALTLIALFSFMLLFRSLGESPTVFLRNSAQRGYMADTSSSFGGGSALAYLWFYGIKMLPVASLVWLASLGSRGSRPGWLWLLHATATLGVLLLIFPRATTLSYLISLALVYHLAVRPLRPQFVVPVALAGLIYVYGTHVWRAITGTMRNPTIQAAFHELPYALSPTGLAEFVRGTDLVDIRIFVLISQFYGRILPLKYGETFTRLVTQWIPRALWPGKPYDLGVEIGRLWNPDTFSGAPPGFFAEMYMNFHVPGVLAGGLLFGGLLAWLYTRWGEPVRSPRETVFYALLAPTILLMPSGTLANNVSNFLVSFGATWLAFRAAEIIGERRKPVTRAQLRNPVIHKARI